MLIDRIFASACLRVLPALGLGLVLAVHTPVFAAPAGMPLVVPAYFDPVGRGLAQWNDLATTAAKVPTIVILNPNSGPGTREDPAYTAAIAKVRAAGGKVIGYVSSSYTKRALTTVVADINLYVSLYKVDGFFIDEMTNDGVIAHLQFYQSVFHYIKGLNARYSVMVNPGANLPELYASLPVADQFVVFEDGSKRYASYASPAWQANYAKSRFVHMVYGVDAALLTKTMQYANSHGAGGVFVTSAGLPNPYKALPAYWSQEVAAAAAIR